MSVDEEDVTIKYMLDKEVNCLNSSGTLVIIENRMLMCVDWCSVKKLKDINLAPMRNPLEMW